tara:strand:+ start:830 stop:1021 length:192 start_codon:yes stop_codon:yes gene_type:complete
MSDWNYPEMCKRLKVGDIVSFKYDRERCGKVVAVQGQRVVVEYTDESENQQRVDKMIRECWYE